MKPLEIQEHCPDCGIGIGKTHEPGCGVEICPECGGQMIVCNCAYEYLGIHVSTMEKEHPDIYHNGLPDDLAERYEEYIRPQLIPWDGVWPGIRECREYGFWCKWTDNGWQKCDANDPDAIEDLNNLVRRTRWDASQKRHILLSEHPQS